MTVPPLVSVLVPAYNAASYLGATLDSVLAQTWGSLEVIVVDDGSCDATLAVARHYAARDNRVRVETQANAGASAARNRAFALATGDWIQYLDADDLLHSDKVRAQLACLAQRPGAELAASAWAMFEQYPDEQALRPTALWHDYSSGVDWLLAAWENGVWMQPSAWLTHRALIEAAGPWDEQISLHDDGEFFSRVLLRSQGDIPFCAAAKSFYRKGLRDSLSSIRNENATRSHLRVCAAYEANLLKIRANAHTRRACADNYQRFIYEYYPAYPALLAQAAARVRELGGSTARPAATPLFRRLEALLGWRVSKRIQNFVYQRGLNPAAWLRR